MCKLKTLPDDVIASPLKQSYGIGEMVTLSCPEGRQLEGETTIICDASLQFSPDTADMECSKGALLSNTRQYNNGVMVHYSAEVHRLFSVQ